VLAGAPGEPAQRRCPSPAAWLHQGQPLGLPCPETKAGFPKPLHPAPEPPENSGRSPSSTPCFGKASHPPCQGKGGAQHPHGGFGDSHYQQTRCLGRTQRCSPPGSTTRAAPHPRSGEKAASTAPLLCPCIRQRAGPSVQGPPTRSSGVPAWKSGFPAGSIPGLAEPPEQRRSSQVRNQASPRAPGLKPGCDLRIESGILLLPAGVIKQGFGLSLKRRRCSTPGEPPRSAAACRHPALAISSKAASSARLSERERETQGWGWGGEPRRGGSPKPQSAGSSPPSPHQGKVPPLPSSGGDAREGCSGRDARGSTFPLLRAAPRGRR